VLSYAALAESFPKELAGRANSALNVLHIGGAFLVQSGIGFVVELWPADGGGHYPADAYATAFGLNVVPQVAALAWFLLCPILLAGEKVAVAAVAPETSS
jgi:hypothetical protein